MSEGTQINLDTSILVNYMYANLPGDIERDRGSLRIIDSAEFHTVIGGKAKGEFDALCNRRHRLYEDVVDYLADSDADIFDYEPRERQIKVNNRDRLHLRKDVKMSWYDLEEREQLSTLRRCFQEIEVYQLRMPNELLDKCFPQQSNDELLRRLSHDLTIGHDREIIVDAVEIARKHSVDTLVALDSDITDSAQITLIREIIEEVVGVSDLLQIVEPSGI